MLRPAASALQLLKIWNSIPPAILFEYYLPTPGRHFSSSSQDLSFLAGLPIRSAPSFLRLRFGFCWPCARYTYLLNTFKQKLTTYLFWSSVTALVFPWFWRRDSLHVLWLTGLLTYRGDKTPCLQDDVVYCLDAKSKQCLLKSQIARFVQLFPWLDGMQNVKYERLHYRPADWYI